MKYIISLMLVMSCGFAIKGFGIGPMGGMHLGDIFGEDEGFDWGYRTGLNGGIVIAQTATSFLDGSFGMVYIQKGAKYEMDVSGTPYTMTFIADYFEAPMVMRFHIPSKAPVVPEILFGAALGVPLKIAGKTATPDTSYTMDYPDEMTESLELEALGGIGIKFVLPFGRLLFDARYSGGATSIFSTDDVHNHGLTLSLGYVMP